MRATFSRLNSLLVEQVMQDKIEQQDVEATEFDDELADEALDRARHPVVTAVCWHCD
jgi:hypothetical protein